jgi:2-iminobutanoate/2-iminopropanoate deaminase
MEIEKITTPNAPVPGGHYTQAIAANGFAFISGQLPIVPGTGERIAGSIEEQTLRVLENIKVITEASGSDLSRIVKVNVYIADIGLWDKVNTVYAEFFGSHKPARAIVPVKELHHGFKIEMDAVAAIDQLL